MAASKMVSIGLSIILRVLFSFSSLFCCSWSGRVPTLNKCSEICGKAPPPALTGKGYSSSHKDSIHFKGGGGGGGGVANDDEPYGYGAYPERVMAARGGAGGDSYYYNDGGTEALNSRRPQGDRRNSMNKKRMAATSEANRADAPTRVDDADNRIVNGYDPDERPWLALLDVAGGSCGGALVNKRYILSAAHCFCRQDETIVCEEVEVDGEMTHKPAYEMSNIKIYLGLNNMPLSKKEEFKENIFGAESVVIRAGWVFGKKFSPDLAIARMDRDTTFSENISPICVPVSPDIKDIPVDTHELMKAYVAGWGASFSHCDTNKFGPSPHTMCKVPFVYNGVTHQGCSTHPPPSKENKVCRQFYRWAKIKDPSFNKNDPTKTYSIFLWDSQIQRARVTSCYSQRATPFGWCGTCYPGDLDPGQEGYCDKYMAGTETNEPNEYGKPTPDKNWGWCNKWCENKDGPSASQALQETELDLLRPEECAEFGKTLEANASMELCTGKKTSFEYIYQFKRVVTTDRKITFKPEGKVLNKLGLTDLKFNFYLGGTDSCQGDSGGPLFRWYEINGQQRAYVIGTVSRGTGCANFNKPGIFSRVKQHLKWIHQVIQSGNC